MAADEAKKKKPKEESSGNSMKMVLIYVGSMAAMTILAIVLVVMVIGPKLSPAPMMPIPTSQAQAKPVGNPNGLAQHVVSLGEFIVNPAGTNGLRYLSVNLSAAVDSQETANLVTNHQAEVSHTIVTTIASRTIQELEQPNGMEELGNAIKDALNEVFGEGRFQRIFFTRFIIQ